jgi:hypothetical protein
MHKIGLSLLALGLLAACGNTETTRAGTGAAAGALGGAVVAGPAGALVGGVGGAATGAVMDEGLEDKTTLDDKALNAVRR